MAASSTFDLYDWRLVADDGTVGGATPLAAVQTGATIDPGTSFRVHILIDEYAPKANNNTALVLQYRINTGTWTNVAAGNAVTPASPTGATDGDSIASGDRQTTGTPTGTYETGEFDSNGAMGTHSFGSGNYAEFAWNVVIDAGSVNTSDLIEFRFTWDGNPPDALSAAPDYPSVTVGVIGYTLTAASGSVAITGTDATLIAPIATVHFYVDTDLGSDANDGTSPASGAWASYAGAITHATNGVNNRDLLSNNEIGVIHFAGATLDTSIVAQDIDCGTTTDADRYWRLIGEDGWITSNNGKWSTSHYRLSAVDGDGPSINSGYVRFETMQLEADNNSGAHRSVLEMVGSGYVLLDRCLGRVNPSSADNTSVFRNEGTGTMHARNCWAYGSVNSQNYRQNSGTLIAHACTSGGGYDGFSGCTTNNCLAYGHSNNDFTSCTGSNNADEDSTAPATGRVTITADPFVDYTNKDFHLASGATNLHNAGADLSSDGTLPVTEDIDGQARDASPSIGADEYVSAGNTLTASPGSFLITGSNAELEYNLVSLAQDAFSRTESNTWGNADQGGYYYTTDSGTPASDSKMSVSGGVGKIAFPNATVSNINAVLSNAYGQDVYGKTRVRVDTAPDTASRFHTIQVYARRDDSVTDGDNYYRYHLRLHTDGSVTVRAEKNVATSLSYIDGGEVTVTGLTWATGTWYWLKWEAVGSAPSTAIRFKVWEEGTAEPDWHIDVVSNEPNLDVPGTVGYRWQLPGDQTTFPVTYEVDDLNYKARGFALEPAAGAVAITGTDATLTVSGGATLTAEAGAFAITGTQANLEYHRVVTAESGSVAITGTAANLEYHRNLTAAAGAYLITGTDANLERNQVVTADPGAFSIAGSTANLEWHRVLVAEAGAVAWTGTDATLSVATNTILTAEAGAYTVTGTAANLEYHRVIAAGAGAVTITGSAANLEQHRVITASAGAYTITGTAANLERGYAVLADPGAFTITGTAANLEWDRALAADPGSVVITGTDASLTVTGDYVIIASPGAVAITGSDAGLLWDQILTAEAGAYTWAGSAAALLHDRILPADAGSVVWTGTAATLTITGDTILTADPGAFLISGTAARLLHATIMPVDAGAYTISGTDASLSRSVPLSAEAGAFAISGAAAALLWDRILAAEAGAVLWTGSDVSLGISIEGPEVDYPVTLYVLTDLPGTEYVRTDLASTEYVRTDLASDEVI